MAFRWPRRSSVASVGSRRSRKATYNPPYKRGSSSSYPSSESMISRTSHSKTITSGNQYSEVRPSLQPSVERFPSITEEDTLDETIMAVHISDRGTVGCSFYSARERRLYFMEDAAHGGKTVVEILKMSVRPTTILISTKATNNLMEALDPALGQNGVATESVLNTELPYVIEQRPSAEFAYESGVANVAGLCNISQDESSIKFVVPSDFLEDMEVENTAEPEEATIFDRIMKLSGVVLMDSRCTVGCAGVIISYLHHRAAAQEYCNSDVGSMCLEVASVSMFSLQDTMFVSHDTMLSLQILHSESHPHLHNHGPSDTPSGSKEGLSVYGIFHRFAVTSQGKSLLRQWFLRPSTDISILSGRLDSISVFLRVENEGLRQDLIQSLRSVVDVSGSLFSLRKGVSAGLQKGRSISQTLWSTLQKFAYHTIGIERTIAQMVDVQRLMIYRKIKNCFDVHRIAQIGKMISEVIDFEASTEQKRTTVNVGVDENLDEKKRIYDGIDDLLSKVAIEMANTIPSGLPNKIDVIYFPQIGFLIAAPVEPGTNFSIWEGDENDKWDKMFSSESVAYYKNSDMKDMDNHFGDIYVDICDREIEIVHTLGQEVIQYANMLLDVSEVCGELDCLLALTQGAKHNGFQKPKVTPENFIDISGGWHPLQGLTVPSFIPNSARLCGSNITSDRYNTTEQSCVGACSDEGLTHLQRPNILLVTGPNYSGKSVYLTQVAIITFLAHVGSFVPAESATVGITDKILACMSKRESVSSIQSTFLTDLQQLCLGLDMATCRSLLLIDEFGKGTNATDGAALYCSVIEHLANRPEQTRPKVISATHFHEIFEAGYLDNTAPVVQFARMEVQVVDLENSRSQCNELTYLYRLVLGERSTASFGIVCASLNGIPSGVVVRAEELVDIVNRGEDLVTVYCNSIRGLTEDEERELVEAEFCARRMLDIDWESAERDPRLLLEDLLQDLPDEKTAL